MVNYSTSSSAYTSLVNRLYPEVVAPKDRVLITAEIWNAVVSSPVECQPLVSRLNQKVSRSGGWANATEVYLTPAVRAEIYIQDNRYQLQKEFYHKVGSENGFDVRIDEAFFSAIGSYPKVADSVKPTVRNSLIGKLAVVIRPCFPVPLAPFNGSLFLPDIQAKDAGTWPAKKTRHEAYSRKLQEELRKINFDGERSTYNQVMGTAPAYTKAGDYTDAIQERLSEMITRLEEPLPGAPSGGKPFVTEQQLVQQMMDNDNAINNLYTKTMQIILGSGPAPTIDCAHLTSELIHLGRDMVFTEENGGAASYARLISKIEERTKSVVGLDDLEKALTQLVSKSIINLPIDLASGQKLIFLRQVSLTNDQIDTLSLASQYGNLTAQQVATELTWDESKASGVLEQLRRLKIAKKDSPNEEYNFPCF